MITFIYPRDDWTAAETIMKMQALAASQGYSVYATPKNTIRDMDYIKIELSKTRYAIFIAIDADSIDDDTNYELSFLKDKNIETYYVVTEGLEIEESDNVFRCGSTPEDTLESIQKIQSMRKEGDDGEKSAALASIGIILFFLWLKRNR